MPKTAEPRYTEEEFDAMYGPRLDKLSEQMQKLKADLQRLIRLLDERNAAKK